MEEKNIKKEELDLIYDEDLMPALDKLGVKEDFVNGNLKCLFCDKTVTLENLYSFFLNNGIVKMVCNDEECVEKLKIKK